ncbi:MAG: FecR domain-containing protein [Bacteroidetes bacterium]|nr:FecR domain-containing protein [Bacteroidota bacterium]
MNSNLIFKYLNHNASEEEVTTVFEWIESSEENKNQFIALKKVWALTASEEDSKPVVWEKIEKEISKSKKRKRFKLWKYAAVFVIFIGLGKTVSVISNAESTTSNKVVLELENGDINYITETQDKNLLNNKGKVIAEQHANEIIYQPKAANNDIAYHTLKIPYGKTFKVTLSDGSIVHLNSGTTLKYPEQFDLESNRKVYLTGEAFFEVAKDKKRPFIVHSNNLDVEVLGTVFNISAYPDQTATDVVLIEGSVRLSENTNPLNNTLLAPNYKASWNDTSKAFDIENVDVNIYKAWTHGELVFKDASFASISKKLERSYNVQIINNNHFLATQKFTGTINIKESSVENILDSFELDTPFEYSKRDNVIEITNPNL